MDNSDPTGSPRGKGRPQAPMKFERYAIVVGRTNMGAKFTAAAEAEIKFVDLNPISKEFVWSSADNDQLPQKPTSRKAAIYDIPESLTPWRAGSGPHLFNGRPLPEPLAFRVDKPLKKGRPRKIKLP